MTPRWLLLGPQLGHNEWPKAVNGGQARIAETCADQDSCRFLQVAKPLASASQAGTAVVTDSPDPLPSGGDGYGGPSMAHPLQYESVHRSPESVCDLVFHPPSSPEYARAAFGTLRFGSSPRGAEGPGRSTKG